MNLFADFIRTMIDDAESRMDAVGIPPTVRDTCPFCRGAGLREMPSPIRHSALTRLDRCAACCGKGFVVLEKHDATEA